MNPWRRYALLPQSPTKLGEPYRLPVMRTPFSERQENPRESFQAPFPPCIRYTRVRVTYKQSFHWRGKFPCNREDRKFLLP